jgi:hypothetical protein
MKSDAPLDAMCAALDTGSAKARRRRVWPRA